MIRDRHSSSTKINRTLAVLVGAILLAGTLGPSASAQVPEPETGPFPYGYFYGTFGELPAMHLLAGGTAEQFCEDSPADPFGSAEPGRTTATTTIASDGTVTITAHDWGQPIHVYRSLIEGAPPWIGRTCADYFASGVLTEPFASGLAQLRIRITIHPDGRVDVFNSAEGFARGADGSFYRVTGSADLSLVNGAPIGNPADFVKFSLTKF